MFMIIASIRPERVAEILYELQEAGFYTVTKMDVVGNGRQRETQPGNMYYYNDISEEMQLMVEKDEDKEDVIDILLRKSRTGAKGAFGDGRICISPVLEAYPISSESI